MTAKPVVLFLCIHNAGRSLAARVLLDHYADGRVDVRSAGSEPADEVSVRGLEHPISVVRLGLHRPGRAGNPDPICHIPLTEDTAFERRRDSNGQTLLFCSDSCLETWVERPAPVLEEPGSIREVWMR